ncbi:hypothetical protein SAZ11_59950 [Streptomyces sp. FXJ1.4098]|nr:hypothetical protein [Streptomyces sp. FXJ1.4098]
MPTADELISPDSIRQLAAILQDTSPSTARWQTVADSSTTLGSLGLSERARTVGDALLADSGLDYPHLAGAVRKALRREDLTGWMIWPVTEAVATAATVSGTTEHFDDGLALLAQLTPRLTGEFALRTFLNTDLARTLATASAWTGSPDPAVRRLASEGTRPKLPWARQVPELNRNPEPPSPCWGNCTPTPPQTYAARWPTTSTTSRASTPTSPPRRPRDGWTTRRRPPRPPWYATPCVPSSRKATRKPWNWSASTAAAKASR